MSRWNAVPARSPYLVQVSTYRSSSGYSQYGFATEVARTSGVPWPAYAITTPVTAYQLTGAGDRNTIVAFFLQVSSQYGFAPHSTSYPPYVADATYIVTHEFGHGLGLGHTGMLSIMNPTWPNGVYMGVTPTTVAQSSGGDVAGLQALYSPSFCVSCVPPH
jgi:hypothetical protein